MFSGIISDIGEVTRVEREPGGLRLAIRSQLTPSPEPGASVSINGVCLTVERIDEGRFEAIAVPETMMRSTLGEFVLGDRVNLERALRVGDELGGHWVQGHVDGVGMVRSMDQNAGDVRLGIDVPAAMRRYIAEKGSVTVDGASLTVAEWDEPVLWVALVPYTLAHTIAGAYLPGTRVNLEADLVARYLDRLLAARGEAPEGRGTVAPGRGR